MLSIRTMDISGNFTKVLELVERNTQNKFSLAVQSSYVSVFLKNLHIFKKILNPSRIATSSDLFIIRRLALNEPKKAKGNNDSTQEFNF